MQTIIKMFTVVIIIYQLLQIHQRLYLRLLYHLIPPPPPLLSQSVLISYAIIKNLLLKWWCYCTLFACHCHCTCPLQYSPHCLAYSVCTRCLSVYLSICLAGCYTYLPQPTTLQLLILCNCVYEQIWIIFFSQLCNKNTQSQSLPLLFLP